MKTIEERLAALELAAVKTRRAARRAVSRYSFFSAEKDVCPLCGARLLRELKENDELVVTHVGHDAGCVCAEPPGDGA